MLLMGGWLFVWWGGWLEKREGGYVFIDKIEYSGDYGIDTVVPDNEFICKNMVAMTFWESVSLFGSLQL